jgi:cobalt transporter subunit CbtB
MNSSAAITSNRTPTDTGAVKASRLPAAVGAALLGLFILFGVGFAQGQGNTIHNAAHDTRHSLVFPCH